MAKSVARTLVPTTRVEVLQAMDELFLELTEKLLEQVETRQDEALVTNTQLRSFVDDLTKCFTTSEDALYQVRTVIAALLRCCHEIRQTRVVTHG